jgi:FkbM family methyltransferase
MNIEEYSYFNFIKNGDVVYDIGAHVGERSIFFASELKAKKVYAFEPVPFNLLELKHNVNQFHNIEILNVALHEKEYECLTKFRHCNTAYSQGKEENIRYKILQNVIDENGLELPNFLKFDIEGMESLVLKTCNFLFEKSRPIFFIEIHAAPKNEPQSYADCPHWKTPEDGGFDFNSLKDFDYKMIDQSLTPFDNSKDWNPVPVQHKGVILIPFEKL